MTTCKPPLVSIGMPVYNEERYLIETLDSLLAQDFGDLELIIADNASQDATQVICLEYASRDPRIRYYRNDTNLGSVENFNRVFRLSKNSKYFMWACGHDVWAATYLSRCLEVLESDESIVVCTSRMLLIGQDGEDLGKEFHQIDTRGYGKLVRFNLAMWEVAPVSFCSVVRTSALQQTHLLQRVLAPDFLVGWELALLGPMAIVPEPLFFPRDNRGEHNRQERRARWGREFRKRLYPGQKHAGGRFPKIRLTVKTLITVSQAPVSYGLKPALLMSTLVNTIVSYPLRHYGRLPLNIRRRVRAFISGLFTRGTKQCLARDSTAVLHHDRQSLT